MAQEKKVQLQDGKISVSTLVEGSGPPLVYFHSYEGLLEFPEWLSFLADRYTVYAPQMPGVGASTGLEHVEDIHDLALFEIDWLEAMGIEKAVLMGHDLGANIALEIAAHNSAPVDKMLLVAPTGIWLEDAPAPDFISGPASAMARHSWHDLDAAREKGLLPSMPTDEDRARTLMLERQKTLTAAGKFLWPLPDKGLRKRAHRIKAPSLLVWGTSDRLLPLAYGHAMSEIIPNSRLAMVEEAGHYPMLEQADEFRRIVLDFLK